MHSRLTTTPLTTPQPISIAELLQRTAFDNSTSFVNQIVNALTNLIETLELRPGELISEKEVAEALQISKTPVREALIRLEEVGFVKIVPRVGSYVTTINMDRYIEACFVRIQLEVGAVQLASKAKDEAHKRALFMPLLEQQKQALEAQAHLDFYHLDQALHRMFFEIADIPGVWKTIKRTQTDVNRIRHLKRRFGISRAAQIIDEHRNIIDAICVGDPKGASAALIAHIGSLDKEIDTLAAHPELLAYIDTLNAAQPRRRERRA